MWNAGRLGFPFLEGLFVHPGSRVRNLVSRLADISTNQLTDLFYSYLFITPVSYLAIRNSYVTHIKETLHTRVLA